MTIFYFTGTGNSLAVAKSFDGEIYSIPQMLKEKRTNFIDDVIGLVYPIYSITTPNIVKQFLREVKLQAKYTFAIATYGNMAGGALSDLQKIAHGAGKHFDYTNTLLMVDNFLPLFDAKSQIDGLSEKKVPENLAKIKQDIDARVKREPEDGFLLKMLSTVLSPISKSMYSGHYSDKYIVGGNCGGCGTCAIVCPTGNCTIADKRATFADRCEACMACIHACPECAIHLKGEKSLTRFRNADVSLSEIVKANRQI